MNRRDLAASSFGNILEWFDFGLFIYLAPVIGQQFFPSSNSKNAAMAVFGVFVAGFVCRPVGGILFGYLGDRYGRVKGLRWSIFVMSCSTLLISILPPYHVIGIFSPLLFTLFRLLHGLSIGGEYSGVMVYLAESSPVHQRGFFTSFAAIGANIGFLMATLSALWLEALFSSSTVNIWVWRIPFISGGVIGLLVLYYRFQLLETCPYLFLKAARQVEKQPFFTAIKNFPNKLLKIFGLTCMGSTFYYVFFGCMPGYLSRQLNVSLYTVFSLQAILLVAMIVCIPLAGRFGDRYGRKKMLMSAAFGIMILTLPCFYLLQYKTMTAIVIALSIATLLSALEQGNILSAFVENCPAKVRYSGVAFAFNLGNALFGGSAPVVVSWLTQTWGNLAPGYYLIGMTAVSLMVIMTLKETSTLSLSPPATDAGKLFPTSGTTGEYTCHTSRCISSHLEV